MVHCVRCWKRKPLLAAATRSFLAIDRLKMFGNGCEGRGYWWLQAFRRVTAIRRGCQRCFAKLRLTDCPSSHLLLKGLQKLFLQGDVPLCRKRVTSVLWLMRLFAS